MGISVDAVADNAAMVEKLVLPFPLLSDARGELIQQVGVWNADQHIAVPSIAVIDQSGTIGYLYSGHDFADRPGDAAIFEALDTVRRGGSPPDDAIEIRVTNEEAQLSIAADKPAMSMQNLLSYYSGAFSSTVALKERLAGLTEGRGPAIRVVSSYQRMITEYRDALRATSRMNE